MSVQQGGANIFVKKPRRRCCKCNSTQINGPVFEQAEKLRYTCGHCGFHWVEKCEDAE
jgi:hypothetical protein